VRAAVDRFFDEVMVMTDDVAVRANRIALLQSLERALNQVADISRLAA
jgi:glycyl-tRNA synthetase beta chain